MTSAGDISADNLVVIAGLLDRDLDLAALKSDEHLRYALYIDALSRVSRETERHLISLVLEDSDHPMRDSALAAHADDEAMKATSVRDYRSWLQSVDDLLDNSSFAGQRAREWLIFKEIQQGGSLESTQAVLGASDWLQRKLSEEVIATPVLTLLAAEGRTKRIRNRAALELRRLTDATG